MRASDRSRRFREVEEAEASRSSIGAEIGWLIGTACGGTVGFVIAQLVATGSDPWWGMGLGCVAGAGLAWCLRRARV